MRFLSTAPLLAFLLLSGCDGGPIDASELRRELGTTWEELSEMAPEESAALREGLEENLALLKQEIERARQELGENDELRRRLEDAQHEILRLLDEARAVGRPAFDRAREETQETWKATRDELIRASQGAELALEELLGKHR